MRAALGLLALLAALIGPVGAARAQTFSTPGAWSYTVPAGVTLVEVKVSGGGGGGGGAGGFAGPAGGNGGTGLLVTAQIAVSPGQVLSGTIGTGGGTGYLTGATQFGLTPCAGAGAGGAGNGPGGNGGKTNCPATGASGGGGGGGGSGSTTLVLGSTTMVQASGGGGGGGGGSGVGGAAATNTSLLLSSTCGSFSNASSPPDFYGDGGGGGGGGGGYFGGGDGSSRNDAFTATGGTSGASCYGNTALIQYTAISASGSAGSAGNGGSATAPGGRGGDGYVTISTAAITVTKSAQPVSNPITGTIDPKLIPGASVQYCITLTNGWARSATSVSISDSIPAQASYVSGSALSGTNCASAASAPSGLSYSAPVLTQSALTLNAGASYALTFLVTVN